jgi:division protein 1
VHRSLVGHTGPITALQFDDVYLVTGSQDRSIRVGVFPFQSQQ